MISRFKIHRHKTGRPHFDLRLKSPHGLVVIRIKARDENSLGEISNLEYGVSLVRAGELVYGKSSEVSPIRGWFSPTYAQKEPALSLAIEVKASETVKFSTEFFLPSADDRQ